MPADNISAYPDHLAQRHGHELLSSKNYHSDAVLAGDIGKLRRHPEADVFGNAWQLRQFDLGQLT